MWLRAYHPPPGLGVGCGCGWGCGWGSGWDSFIIAPLTVSHFGAVLIAKLDRCTRSVADLATLIDTFSRRGVALISAAESLDTSSAGGRLVVNVLGAVAQWEREATAERTSAALQVLRQQGRATGGVAPYGFQFIDGRRAWDQGEQETLAAIIEHRRAGLSWAKVADTLNATGHRTPLDAPGRPPSPPGARPGARRRSVKGARRAGARPGARKPPRRHRQGGARSIRSIIAKRAAAAGVAGRVSGQFAPGRLRSVARSRRRQRCVGCENQSAEGRPQPAS